MQSVIERTIVMANKLILLIIIFNLMPFSNSNNMKYISYINAKSNLFATNHAMETDEVLPYLDSFAIPTLEPIPYSKTISVEEVIHAPVELPLTHKINAPIIPQYPELLNGCEVTSLAMLLQFMGLNYSKMDLADKLTKDNTSITWNDNGKIVGWGDPNLGFVGDITGVQPGYAVNVAPLENLMKKINVSKNLTGHDFKEIKKSIAQNKPVILWTTVNFAPTNDWIEWVTPDNKIINATFKTHTVLLVGYDEEHVYVNNPLNGVKSEKVNMELFLASWEQLGKQALTYAE